MERSAPNSPLVRRRSRLTIVSSLQPPPGPPSAHCAQACGKLACEGAPGMPSGVRSATQSPQPSIKYAGIYRRRKSSPPRPISIHHSSCQSGSCSPQDDEKTPVPQTHGDSNGDLLGETRFSGPRFIMPEIVNTGPGSGVEDGGLSDDGSHSGSSGRACYARPLPVEGRTAYLQVPYCVPRRRHSWICG